MRQWPKVALGEIAPIVRRPVVTDFSSSYPELGVRSHGKGTFHKPTLLGSDVGSKRLYRIEKGDLVFSNVFAWEGAVAVARDEDHGRFGSHRFITCVVDEDRANVTFIYRYLTASRGGLEQIRQASPGGAGRNRTLGIDKLARVMVPLPPRSEQQAIVKRLDTLADKAQQVNKHIDAIERDADRLLAVRFRDAVTDAPFRPMAQVAPLLRREIVIDPQASYTELGVRSFFKGTFQRRTMKGVDYSWQNLFSVKGGDLIFSNIMAWEQAIAIAKPEDGECVGNHRMLTCEVNGEVAVAGILYYYFTTAEGFAKIDAASPGTAARNKTLKAPDLMAIEVPIPTLATQRAFDALQAKIAALKARHITIRQANDALIPATLERVFSNAD